jgi:hypothetical protein
MLEKRQKALWEAHMSSEDGKRPVWKTPERRGRGGDPWERPALRRLKASKAESGPQPCNDGLGGGGCNTDNHSGRIRP